MGRFADPGHRQQAFLLISPRSFVGVRLASVAALMAGTLLPPEIWLGDDERRRLSLMRSERRRDQFLAGHWLARELAAEHWGRTPESWEIADSAAGVPRFVPGTRKA